MGFEKSTVLRLLAAGVSPKAIADRFTERLGRCVTLQEVRGALHEAEARTANGGLLPAAEAAFVDDYGAVVAFAALRQDKPPLNAMRATVPLDDASVRPSPADLHRLRLLSLRIIRAYLGDDEQRGELLDPVGAEQRSIALQYAEATLRQAEVIERLTSLSKDEAPLQVSLPAPDRKRLEEFLLYRNLRGRFETLDSMTDGWQRLADSLRSHPETLLYEEYADRLVTRDSTEDAVLLLAPPARSQVQATLHSLDERFYAATHESSTSIKSCSPWRPQRWWWFRVPQVMATSFQRRLKSTSPGMGR